MVLDFLFFNIIDVGIIKRNIQRIKTDNRGSSGISCRISGNAQFYTNTNEYAVNENDVIYIPKGSTYSQTTNGEEIIFIELDVYGNAPTEIKQAHGGNNKRFSEIFAKILMLWTKKEPNYKNFCTSLLYELIGITNIMHSQDSHTPLSIACEYIDNHFCDYNFSLEKACELGEISRTYFNRIFKERFNVTPVTYINNLKIEKAKMLLSCGEYTHDEIAELCAFNSTKYFYTVYKKITNTTTKQLS